MADIVVEVENILLQISMNIFNIYGYKRDVIYPFVLPSNGDIFDITNEINRRKTTIIYNNKACEDPENDPYVNF